MKKTELLGTAAYRAAALLGSYEADMDALERFFDLCALLSFAVDRPESDYDLCFAPACGSASLTCDGEIVETNDDALLNDMLRLCDVLDFFTGLDGTVRLRMTVENVWLRS